MTRLLNTPIIGPSAKTVASSWIDMLAGLSGLYILRIPPGFWASVALARVNIASAAPIAVTTRSFPVTPASLANRRRVLPPVLGRRSRRLSIQPHVFHAPAVVDAVAHDR